MPIRGLFPLEARRAIQLSLLGATRKSQIRRLQMIFDKEALSGASLMASLSLYPDQSHTQYYAQSLERKCLDFIFASVSILERALHDFDLGLCEIKHRRRPTCSCIPHVLCRTLGRILGRVLVARSRGWSASRIETRRSGLQSQSVG